MSCGPVTGNDQVGKDFHTWRRPCGCIKTSEKLKKILNTFPPPPSPTPIPQLPDHVKVCTECLKSPTNRFDSKNSVVAPGYMSVETYEENKKLRSTTWQVIAELVLLVQLSVTATALALYYIIYCYMQLVYYTLRSAIYFHNADMPMKITIGVVTTTSLIVGFNLIIRLERVFDVFY